MARATNFSSLCDLIKKAETKLISEAGMTDPIERLETLRGIYYGTSWSKDFRSERSKTRNWGFTLFTGFGSPSDPRPVLGESLFKDLMDSQDVSDGPFKIDTGHAIIGMESRSNAVSRLINIPSQGGTGLEIVTWLGDLGGGAANLAWHRSASKQSSRSVKTIFSGSGSDYGASINLEGDVAAYLIGAGATLVAPKFSSRIGIAELFRQYLPISASSKINYMRRAKNFLTIMGGSFRGNGTTSTLNNPNIVIGKMSPKIREFAEAYMIHRFIVGQGRPSARVLLACRLLPGAANEVAGVFVNALQKNIGVRKSIHGLPPFPKATPAGRSCHSKKLNAVSLDTKAMKKAAKQTVLEGLLWAAKKWAL